jgi:hypothetical protein
VDDKFVHFYFEALWVEQKLKWKKKEYRVEEEELTLKHGTFFKKLFEKKGKKDSASTSKASSDMKKCISELQNKAIIVRKATGIDLEKEYEYTAQIQEAIDSVHKGALWILPLLIYGSVYEVMEECKQNGSKITPRYMFQIAIHNMAKKGELFEQEAIHMLIHHAKQEEIEIRKLAGKEITIDDINQAFFIVGINKIIERKLVIVGSGGLLHITYPCSNFGSGHFRVAYDSDRPPGLRFGLWDANVIMGKQVGK